MRQNLIPSFLFFDNYTKKVIKICTQNLFCELLNEWNMPALIINNSEYKWNEYNEKIASFLNLNQG